MTEKDPGTTGSSAAEPRTDVTPGGDVLAAPAAPEGREELEVVEVRTGMFGAHGSGDTSGFGGLVRPVTRPLATPRPYGGWYDEVVDVLAEVWPRVGQPSTQPSRVWWSTRPPVRVRGPS